MDLNPGFWARYKQHDDPRRSDWLAEPVQPVTLASLQPTQWPPWSECGLCALRLGKPPRETDPHLKVITAGGRHYLWDGHHRAEQMLRNGTVTATARIRTLPVKIINGSGNTADLQTG